MSTDEIVWEDPPKPQPGRRAQWPLRLAPLMENVGVWARVKECPSKNAAAVGAANIRRRQVQVPPGKWESTSRTVDGHCYVYARYLGPEDDE